MNKIFITKSISADSLTLEYIQANIFVGEWKLDVDGLVNFSPEFEPFSFNAVQNIFVNFVSRFPNDEFKYKLIIRRVSYTTGNITMRVSERGSVRASFKNY